MTAQAVCSPWSIVFSDALYFYFRSRDYSRFVVVLCSWAWRSSWHSWEVGDSIGREKPINQRDLCGWVLTFTAYDMMTALVWHRAFLFGVLFYHFQFNVLIKLVTHGMIPFWWGTKLDLVVRARGKRNIELRFTEMFPVDYEHPLVRNIPSRFTELLSLRWLVLMWVVNVNTSKYWRKDAC